MSRVGTRRRSRRQESRSQLRGALVAGSVVAVIAVGFASLGEPAVEPGRSAARETPHHEGRVRVEVLNGGKVDGMAREATFALRRAGFDVVHFGNAPSFDEERPSAVTDRVGRPELAQAVADALGIDNVRSEPDPNLYVDVSVWLGREWTDPAAAAGGTEGDARRAWWDPRGWLSRRPGERSPRPDDEE